MRAKEFTGNRFSQNLFPPNLIFSKKSVFWAFWPHLSLLQMTRLLWFYKAAILNFVNLLFLLYFITNNSDNPSIGPARRCPAAIHRQSTCARSKFVDYSFNALRVSKFKSFICIQFALFEITFSCMDLGCLCSYFGGFLAIFTRVDSK